MRLLNECPELYKNRFLNYKALKKVLKRNKTRQDGPDHHQERFFTELRQQLADVNRHFATQATLTLEAHRNLKETAVCGCFTSPTIQKQQAQVAQRAHWCRKYAKANATALRKILKKYDRMYCSKSGQAFLQKCWRSESEAELGLILHSPLVDHLKAMQASLRSPLPPEDLNLVERAPKAILLTRADKQQHGRAAGGAGGSPRGAPHCG